MRINKYIAKSGIASRRKAEQFILDGQITVNGETIFDLSYRVQEGDIVSYEGQIIKPIEQKFYFMLNKPIGYTSTNEDKYADKTIFDLINEKVRLFSIGRLDKDSRGLILLTNDGDLYNAIIHPRKVVYKRYELTLNKRFNEEDIIHFTHGIDIGDYLTQKANIILTKNPKKLFIEISEGKNRQVRRMFDVLGYRVEDLNRVSIEKLNLGDLPVGKYRPLTNEEIKYLYTL
ncbi:MAG: rRNA pseudouridine synthase [Tissierellia bacterium]|nr:rRNA pseudouridine synthase [Tissierellia bacterium]